MAAKSFMTTSMSASSFFHTTTASTTTSDSSMNPYESDLSDPPSDLDDYEFDLDANFYKMAIKSPPSIETSRIGNRASRLKRPRPSHDTDREDTSVSSGSDDDDDDLRGNGPPGPKRFRFWRSHYSRLELIPNEVLNQIAFYVNNDRDFVSLASSCTILAQSLIPSGSAVWKKRFLSLYDYPLVDEQNDYAVAYQIRRFVLSQFVAFTNADDERLKIQMDVLRDMVIETYLPSQQHLPAPVSSRNLAAFESPQNSPWMLTFLSTAMFPSTRKCRFGQPHPLFDALQVCLSHLLLSPASKVAHAVDSSRGNYDLLQVYNWNQAFDTLYRRVLIPKEQKKKPDPWMKRKKFPKLRDRISTAPEPPEFVFELDMHALLHIRNFWHRHFIDDTRGFAEPTSRWIGEDTYAKMAKTLCEMGLAPNKWDKPLNSLPSSIPCEWYGNYSCLHPWPKSIRDLEERQTCAEDWNSVDPLKLEFSTSQSNCDDGFWPPIFSCIPAFDNTIPDSDTSTTCTVIQGLANFIDLSSIGDRRTSAGSQSTLTLPKLPKYHPFLSLRLRGVIHPIASQPTSKKQNACRNTGEEEENGEEEDMSITGWNRIVMVMYKPTKRYLIQVLEYAEENYGDLFGPVVSMQLTQNGNQTAQSGQANNNNDGSGDADQTTTTTANATNNQQQQASVPAFDSAEAEVQLQEHLQQKLLSKAEWRSAAQMDRQTIEAMENKFRSNYALDWNDMEYAYAYEGVIIPGGKIMLGRWWRCGMLGAGPGKELDPDGLPVVVVADGGEAAENSAGDGNGSAGADAMDVDGQDGGDAAAAEGTASQQANAGNDSLERGPFVFWC